MKSIKIWQTNFLFSLFFIFSCNIINKKDSRIDNELKIDLLFDNDTIKVNTIRKMKVWGIEYIDGHSFVSTEKISLITNNYIESKKYDSILSINLYFSNEKKSKKWLINISDVKNVGLYYVENNTLKSDFFMYSNKLIESYDYLSDIYCDAVLPFLFDKSNFKKNLSVITFDLNQSEMPKMNELNLSLKKDDPIYILLNNSRKNHLIK